MRTLKLFFLSIFIPLFILFTFSDSQSQSKKFRLGFTGCFPSIHRYDVTKAQDFSLSNENYLYTDNINSYVYINPLQL